jgi:hypothetical protein
MPTVPGVPGSPFVANFWLADQPARAVSLHSEAEANVFGLYWRPLYEVRLAAMQGLEGLADYATSMFSFVFYLPAILLWLATILAGASLAWKLLRLAARLLFVKKLERVPA